MQSSIQTKNMITLPAEFIIGILSRFLLLRDQCQLMQTSKKVGSRLCYHLLKEFLHVTSIQFPYRASPAEFVTRFGQVLVEEGEEKVKCVKNNYQPSTELSEIHDAAFREKIAAMGLPGGDKILWVKEKENYDAETSIFFLLENGVLYAYGDNQSGKLGVGMEFRESKNIKGMAQPVKTIINGKEIQGIFANDYTTIFIMASGQAYLSGSRINSYERAYEPMLLENFPKKVVKIIFSIGSYSIYVITEHGELYAWGRNWNGQLGVGEEKDVTVPTLIKIDGKVKDVTLLALDSAFITLEDGRVFACGNNRNRDLGLADPYPTHYHYYGLSYPGPEPTAEQKLDRFTPVMVPGLPPIRGVYSGLHTLFLSEGNKVFYIPRYKYDYNRVKPQPLNLASHDNKIYKGLKLIADCYVKTDEKKEGEFDEEKSLKFT